MASLAMQEIDRKIEAAMRSLPEYFIVSVISPPDKYAEVNMAIARYMINKRKMSGVYITMNKPYTSLVQALERNKVNTKKIFFIDAISGVVGGEKEAGDNYTTLTGPSSLTDLGIAISKACEAKNPRFMIMDSLSTMLVYNSAQASVRFVHYWVTQLRKCAWPGVIFSLDKDIEKGILESVTQFCDKIITL